MIAGLLTAWFFGIHSFTQVVLLGIVLGVAGASFAVALPLASRWYPPQYQGIALGIAGAGNSGTVFAALFAPGLAATSAGRTFWDWPLFRSASRSWCTSLPPRTAPTSRRRRRSWSIWRFCARATRGGSCSSTPSSFGGFSGLASSLTIYFNSEYGLSPVTAGYFTAAAVFAGSLVRPIGGALADRVGGIRALSIMYIVAAVALAVVSLRLPQAWMALGVFIVGMLALGMGNGSVFQLVPQRFRREIGVMTGLVGMTGGIGGFYLASSLGYSKQLTGSYQLGFLIFAGLAALALLGLTGIKSRWRTTWGASLGLARI